MTDFITRASSSNPPADDQVNASLGATSSVELCATSKAFLASIHHHSDPVNFFEAVKDPIWCEAMNAEL